VLLKEGVRGGDAFLVNTVKVAAGCLSLAAFVSLLPGSTLALASPTDYLLAAYLGLTGPLAGWYLYTAALSGGSVGAVSTVANTYPLTALVAAAVVTRRPPRLEHGTGAALVVGGLWLLAGGGTAEARYLAMAGLTSVLWGVNQVVARALAASSGSLAAALYRALFAVVFAAPVAVWRRRGLPPRSAALAAAAGVVTDFAAVVLWMEALRLGGIAVAATLTATSPLFAAALSRVILRERLSGRQAAGVVLAVAGVALVSSAS